MGEVDFTGVGPFAKGLTAERRGKLALHLTKACHVTPAARPAAIALGSLFDPAKLDEAMGILNGLPPTQRRHVMSRYSSLARLSGERPC